MRFGLARRACVLLAVRSSSECGTMAHKCLLAAGTAGHASQPGASPGIRRPLRALTHVGLPTSDSYDARSRPERPRRIALSFGSRLGVHAPCAASPFGRSLRQRPFSSLPAALHAEDSSLSSDDEQQQLQATCLPDRIGFLGAGQVGRPLLAAAASAASVLSDPARAQKPLLPACS